MPAAERVALVTGASSGIGLHTALGLAQAGMQLAMVGRDRDRTEAARRFVRERSGSDQIRIFLADFARLAEVRRLAEEILFAHDRIDLLVNNAGLMSRRYRFSFDGFELTFAMNHLAPFLLTNLLLDRLKASTPARIVNVASEAHRGHRLNFSDLARPHDWGTLRAYGRSKLCNILFTRELAARLDGSGVIATCLHPGVVATAIGQRGGLTELAWRLMKPFMKSPEQGAQTSLFLATDADPQPFHGGYVIDQALAHPDPAALDGNVARRLWEESTRLVSLYIQNCLADTPNTPFPVGA
jgi:retinol dehydrogenase-14